MVGAKCLLSQTERKKKISEFITVGEKSSLAKRTASGFLKFYCGIALLPFLLTFSLDSPSFIFIYLLF